MSTLSQFFPAGGNVPSNAIPIQLLVIGGGGGSFHQSSGGVAGGGGAGRYIYIENAYVIPSVSYTITVGAGGGAGVTGGESSFTSLIRAPGGGGGALEAATGGGGSGAGGSSYTNQAVGNMAGPVRHGIITAHLGNPNVSSKIYFGPETIVKDLGHHGGHGVNSVTTPGMSGGGGGAGGPGFTGQHFGAANLNHNVVGGAGGVSVACDITGTVKYYAGGGSTYASSNYPSGNNTYAMANAFNSGPANTGGGGGGAVNANGTLGGSGVVVVAYSDSYPAASTTGSPNTPTRSGFRVYEFTGSGSITFA